MNTKEQLKEAADKNLPNVRQLLIKLPQDVKQYLGSRSLFDNSFYRDVLFNNNVTTGFIEVRQGTPSNNAVINMAFDQSVSGLGYKYDTTQSMHQLFKRMFQELIINSNIDIKYFLVSVPLDQSHKISFFRNQGFELVLDQNILSRNKIVFNGDIAPLIYKVY